MILLGLVVAIQAVSVPPAADRLHVGSPRTILEVEASALQGTPARLAWSPDGRLVYLQARRREDAQTEYLTHFIISVEAETLERVTEEPEWALDYWAWKSAQTAPGRPEFRIEVDIQSKQVAGLTLPMDGGLARGAPPGSGGVSEIADQAALAAIAQRQLVTVCTLHLHGEVLGEWINEPVVPGMTFGWASPDLGVIAYVDGAGRLRIMDVTGRTGAGPKSKNALLPAWSHDGHHLAFIESKGRGRFEVRVSKISWR